MHIRPVLHTASVIKGQRSECDGQYAMKGNGPPVALLSLSVQASPKSVPLVCTLSLFWHRVCSLTHHTNMHAKEHTHCTRLQSNSESTRYMPRCLLARQEPALHGVLAEPASEHAARQACALLHHNSWSCSSEFGSCSKVDRLVRESSQPSSSSSTG